MIEINEKELPSISDKQDLESEIVIEPVIENAESLNEKVEEVAVSEDSGTEASLVEETTEEKPAEPSYEEIVVLLKQYFNALRDSIRLAKTKDETIAKMKTELIKYREDFGYSLLKQAIMSLISFREDAKNTLRNISKFSADVESSKKYLGYLDDDFVEVLSTLNITFEDGVFYLNNKKFEDITPHVVAKYEPKPVEEEVQEGVVEENCEAPQEEMKPVSLKDVIDLVNENKVNIEAILKDNALLDESFKEVEVVAASIDANYSDAYLIPSYKKIANFYLKLHKMIEKVIETITEENKTSLYSEVLVYIISATSELLTHFGVEIDVDITNVYDMKTNRMLKFVPTTNPDLDKTVAFRHTDTYFFKGKPIYFSKVDVYKYEQQ